jgi:hypothetical protein
MPLDNPQKIAHIQQVVNRSFAGRTKTVVVVYLSGGVYSYVPLSCIFRPEQIVDPQVANASGGPPQMNADYQLLAPLGTNFTGAVYVADTATASASAVAAAPKYEIIEALPVGIVPGGSHIRVLLRRLR